MAVQPKNVDLRPHGSWVAFAMAGIPTILHVCLVWIPTIASILLSFTNRWLGFGLYWVVALIWLVPDRRIERVLSGMGSEGV